MTADGSTLAEVLDSLEGNHPGIRARILDDSGALRRFVNVYVGDDDVRFIGGLDAQVAEGTKISIIPAVAGGAAGLAGAAPGTNVGRMDLERFVTAQDSGGTLPARGRRTAHGRKTSHWMWFIFPQIAGLGRSAMAQAYAISDLAEAQAYLAHPVLGPRLIECAEIVASHRGLSAEADLRRHRCDQAALLNDTVRARRSRSRGLQAGHRPVFRGTGPGDRAANLRSLLALAV